MRKAYKLTELSLKGSTLILDVHSELTLFNVYWWLHKSYKTQILVWADIYVKYRTYFVICQNWLGNQSNDIESVPDAIPKPSFAAVRALERPTIWKLQITLQT